MELCRWLTKGLFVLDVAAFSLSLRITINPCGIIAKAQCVSLFLTLAVVARLFLVVEMLITGMSRAYIYVVHIFLLCVFVFEHLNHARAALTQPRRRHVKTLRQ